MQDRLNQNDVTNRVNVEKPSNVRDAVLRLYGARYPGADFAALERAFDDFHALYEGRYPGYLACDTLYHDMRHTLDMSLAMARLIDGHERIRELFETQSQYVQVSFFRQLQDAPRPFSVIFKSDA